MSSSTTPSSALGDAPASSTDSAGPTSVRRVVVASANPVKVRATELALAHMFPDQPFEVEGHATESGVADQPRTEAETLAGARQRAAAVAREHPQARLWLGIEGGIEDRNGEMMAFAWVVARGAEVEGDQMEGKGRSASFVLPPEVRRLVLSGLELGDADDRVFGTEGSKRKGGAVGLLTGGALDRAGLYEQAVLLALIPLRSPALYSPLPAGS
ncbi:MAG: inosine/xanthosine triphosphatase [Acidobacteriota bacterium]|nr:inosine/xanthosine triphosphatase [Acidobacteriota bacterium]